MSYVCTEFGQITKWLLNSKHQDTQYGVLSNFEWLEFERDRFGHDAVEIRTVNQGMHYERRALFWRHPV